MKMSIVTIIFKIVEPMMFRESGEFDPFVRGVQSKASTLPLPTPSTVVGALTTYCIAILNKSIPKSNEWLERYKEVLGDVKIKGLLLSLNGELLIEDRISNGFLDMITLKSICEKKYKKLSKKLTSIEELNKEEEEPKVIISFEESKSIRIGTALEKRSESSVKIAKEGYLYGTEYIDYFSFKKKKVDSVKILSELKGDLANELILSKESPIKFGGESRVALLSFKKDAQIFNKIKSELWDNKDKHSGILALYLSTPALFRGGKRIKEYIKEWTNQVNYNLLEVYGESELLSAGFELEGKRKPIYSSLKPGSIIFIEGKDLNLSDIYWGKGLGEASEIGYGTLLPVPLKV
jgi:CRISPR type III-B/RAMP module-associated protein Cmr3